MFNLATLHAFNGHGFGTLSYLFIFYLLYIQLILQEIQEELMSIFCS